MQLCRVTPVEGGFLLDPSDYLQALPTLANQLPPGAAAYATDPQHYDFSSEYCVKDLKVERIEMIDGRGQLAVAMDLAFNDIEGVPRLSIVYSSITGLTVTASSGYYVRPDWITERTKRLGDVQLDEIMPHANGCSHEIQMINGSITLICQDLTATWR